MQKNNDDNKLNRLMNMFAILLFMFFMMVVFIVFGAIAACQDDYATMIVMLVCVAVTDYMMGRIYSQKV